MTDSVSVFWHYLTILFWQICNSSSASCIDMVKMCVSMSSAYRSVVMECCGLDKSDVTFLEHHVLETELFTVASGLVAKHFVVHVTWPGPTVLPLRFQRQSVSC
jgi:hypothetical protein